MNNTRGAGRTDIRVVRNSESKTETMSETPIEYFATCPKGFEQLLAEELKRLRAKRVRPLKSGVAFFWHSEGWISSLLVVAYCLTCATRNRPCRCA